MATVATGRLDEPFDVAETGQRWLDDAVPLEDRAVLATQGFVAFHTLPSGQRCAKLRFRDSKGRQRVRYLGTNPQLACQVAAALKARQRSVRRRRASSQMARRGRQALREAKCRLESPLRCAGWHFHGLRLRRRRSHAKAATDFASIDTFHIRSLTTMENELHQALEGEGEQAAVRRQIFDDLRRSALEHDDPLQVVLRYVTADLLDMSSSMCEPIKAELQAAPDPLDALEDLRPGIDDMLKLSRQADRLLNVSLRHEGFQPAAKAKNGHLDTYAPTLGITSTESPPAEVNVDATAAVNRPR